MAFLASLQIYILPIKYSPPEIRQLTASIIIHGAHVADQPTRADIIVTRLMSRKRLELALGAQIVVRSSRFFLSLSTTRYDNVYIYRILESSF